MRRKLWIFALIICLCIPSIFSCKKKENSGKNDSSVYTIVYENTKLGLDVAESIKDELTSICDVSIVDANAQKKEREIVVGKTDRAISQRAYACLEKINIESETEHRYVIYSDGTNVAIAYDFDSYDVGAAAKSALDIFIKDFIEGKDKLAFGNGILNSGVVDFIEYQSALDEIKKEEEWVALENAIDPKYSEEIISALRTLYSIYSKDVVTWYANLYEPSICVCNGACEGTVNCGGGGFYYSNSARDTVGYLPDVESTRQALNFISASGIATSMGGQSYVDFIPESMKKQIITFIRGLQDENGYFYHPQWGKELTDSQISRRARDLNWSTKTLTDLGVSPRYDTPNGIKGDGTATPVSALTSRLGSSAVSAVSFVMPAASSYVAPHLKDDTSFKAYLNSLPIETESYEVGNELASQAGQIIARDRVLKSEGKKYSLVDIAIEWLNSKQNPETGTWDAKSDYHATNGLMKISCFYNDVGAYLPNADKAVASALFSMTTDEDPYNVCCIYNNWYTIGNVIDNIRDHGGDSAAAEVAKVRELLYAQGAESIIASAQKLLLFKKLDGSFSYKQEYSSYTSQGMPVCEPYTNEGDVNATDICIEGTLNNIFKSLGLKSYFVHFLGKADAIKYLMILENLQPVIKDEITANTDYITFDDDKVGEVPVEVTPTLRSSLASLGVVKSNRGEGKVLRFSSPADSGNGNSISFTCSTASQKCYVFESDLCIESADEGYVIQLTMGRCYMLAFRIADGKLNLWDSSNTSSTARIETELGVAPKIGQWFNLKVEYYVGDDENVRIIVYYNGKPTAVSNNYYDNTASRVETGYGKPSSSYTGVTISTISSRSSVLLMDNVALYKNSKIYSVPVGDLYQNVDEVKNAENVFGFDTAENETDFPDELTVNGEGVVITDHNLGKALAFTASGKGSVLVPFARRSIGARCDLYDFEIVIDESSVDSYLDVRLRENNSGQKSVTAFRIEVKDGYAVICDAPDGEVTETYDSVKIPLGESVRVTFEYFEREHLTLIYINGILCTASKAHSSYGKQYIPGMLEFSVGGTEGLVTIDNIRAEKVLRQLSDALKPSDDTTIHDFEKTDFDAILSGDASIEHIGTSNVVSISNGGKIVLPIEKNGVVTNSVYVTLDLNILGEGDLGVYYLAFADNAGLPVYAIGIQREGNKIYFHEYSVSGILAPSFYVDSTDKELNLTVRLYLEENEVQIFVGDKCVAVSSVFYNDDAQNRTPEKIVISGISGNSKLTVDNVRTELVYSIYESRNDIFESYIDNSTKLTFDESITHRIPSHITARYATSAKTRINEFLVYSVRSKVLTFGTAAGGNDTLEITVTERSHNYNKVVFESDLYTNFIGCSSGKPQYHVFFETASGIAYQFRIVLENGKLTFRDHDNTAQGANVPSNISPNEWFNLRIEIELGDSDDFKASCYVNNKKLFESNHYYGKSENQKPYTSVERVRFYTMSAMTSDISFDNVVFAQSVKEAEPPKEESSAEILPVKGGANGIVVLMHDDGDLVSASILDSIYRKYSLRGNVSLIVDRVYDVENGVAMDSKVSAWNSLFESGRWQLTSHSKTHDFWGVDNSNGKITDEIVASQTILRNLFATQKVLTFAYPGFSAYEDTYSQEEIYGIAKDLVSEHYISGRYFGSEGAFDMGDVDWDFVIAESIGQSYLNQTLTTIDNAANGKMAIIFMHDVCQDTSSVPSQTVTYSHMDAIAQHLSSYVKDGLIWNAFYEDAVMYLKELETAKLRISKNEDVYSVSITDELPDEIYNYPLSVRIKVSEEWEAVKVVQGGVTSYAVCKTIDGECVADVDVVPNGTEATVVAVPVSEVPKDEEGTDIEEVGGNIDFENSALGGDVAINSDASLSISGSNVDGFDKFVSSESDDIENKIYKVIAKNLGSNAHVYVDRASSDSESGNYYIFSTKLYLDALLDGAMLPASNSFATLDFRIKGTSNIFYTVNLRRIRINKDTPDESRGLVFTPKSDLNTYLNKENVIAYNTWVDLTVELYIDKDSGNAVSKIYLGENLIGSETTTVTSSLIDSVPTRVDIKYLKNASSAMYFDEINFLRSETPFLGENNDDNEEEEKPDLEVDPSTMNFDGCEIGDTTASSLNDTVNMSLSTTSDPNFKALIEASTNGSGKHLAIENRSTSNKHIRFDFDKSKGNFSGNTYTVKMKMFISSEGAVHDANFADIDFRTTGGALLYTARMFWSVKDGVTTVSLRSNSKTDDYGEFVSGIPTNEWIEFEMVCFTYVNENGENAVDSSILINGTRLGGHTGLTISGASTPITVDVDRFNIKTYGNKYSKFYIDDLVFTRENVEKNGN